METSDSGLFHHLGKVAGSKGPREFKSLRLRKAIALIVIVWYILIRKNQAQKSLGALATPARRSRMFETRGLVGSTLSMTLQGFCHAISTSSKRDFRHSMMFSRSVQMEYYKGFFPSLRVFTKIREVLDRSYSEALCLRSHEIAGCPQKIELYSGGGRYTLRWAEESFTIVLVISRRQSFYSELYIVGSDMETVRTCAAYAGLTTTNITYTADTKFTLQEVAGLNWNESARTAKIPMWEWKALLSKYSSK